MKPFIMVSTRSELEVAQDEYDSFLAQSGLAREDLQHLQLEEADFLRDVSVERVSGVFIGGSPYNITTPARAKTRSQLDVERQVRDLLAVALKEGVPLLATGFGLQVLAGYLGTAAGPEYAEELGSADVFLTADGRQDPLLAGLPQAFTVFVGHDEGVGEVPAHATLLASSPDCPVQMVRVGRNVYGTQFNPELDVERFKQRVSIYDEAGYGDPDLSEDILSKARSEEPHQAGRIIRNFVAQFSRD
ncbi:gamma-glutamyl-gamma-aminobutyrate hydrolase family protein [Actinomyces bowdenii]|uniref:glutamine amidotransferase-related protein n=1 Tax=Actinomyces bowdenii TaxID=131109 RepID=UPI001ABBE475|nr:gamma-glutamyl-gamma-aminobutyrate hydrolase family protein [Actinomyces bowdenii]